MTGPPLPPSLADRLSFPRAVQGSADVLLGTWVPTGGLAVAKCWRPAGGPPLDTRHAWQARAHAALGPHCPEVLHHAVHGSAIWTVSRFVPGHAPSAPLPPRLAARALALLARLHRAGLAHRDIKADNLRLRRDGRLLVLDLEEVWPTELPCSGPPLGPPEAQDPAAAPGSPAADRYALGALLAPGPLRRALQGPLPCRAGALAELAPDLAPVGPAGPVPPVTGWAELHAVPRRAAALLGRPGGPAAAARLHRQGVGRTEGGCLWLECAELDLLEALLRPPRLSAATRAAWVGDGRAGLLVAHGIAHGQLDAVLAGASATRDPATLRRASWHIPPDHPLQQQLLARLLARTDPAAALEHWPEASPVERAQLLLATAPAAALQAAPPGPSMVRAEALARLDQPQAALEALPDAPAPPVEQARRRVLQARCHLALDAARAAATCAEHALQLTPPGAVPPLRCAAALALRQAQAALPAPPRPDVGLLHNLLHHLPPALAPAAVRTECRLARAAGDPVLAQQLPSLLEESP